MTPATRLQQSQADQLRDLAIAVRRLGNGYRQDPESIAMEKDRVSKELVALARRLEEARP